MSNFLDNLKQAVDTGVFNSEAAQKINELVDKSETVLIEKGLEQIEKEHNEKVKEIKLEPVTPEFALEQNKIAEKKMELDKLNVKYYKMGANLMNMEDDIQEIMDGVEIKVRGLLKECEIFKSEIEKESIGCDGIDKVNEIINQIINKYKLDNEYGI
jgi:hypothetical protein